MGVKVGDRITMVGSDIHKQNRQRTMTVIGIYDIGIPTMERQTAYISLAEAQALFGLDGQSTEIQVNIKQLGEEESVVSALAPALPGYEVESWNQNYPELEQAINSKGAAMTVFGIIILGGGPVAGDPSGGVEKFALLNPPPSCASACTASLPRPPRPKLLLWKLPAASVKPSS